MSPLDCAGMSYINSLIRDGALFVVNHSGGKDSQAMMIRLARVVPIPQLLVIHADLPGVDWPGIADHIRDTIPDGVQFIECRAVKTFFGMVEGRGMFPSPKNRQCTSDLKRGPIEREIRRYLARNPQFRGQVVNCMGMRADESPDRAKRATFGRSERNSKAGRAWFEWLPVHSMTLAEVWRTISDAGQAPHPAYAAGMTRLSCCFCIMSSRADLRTAARLRPDLLAEYDALERRVGQVMMMPGKDGPKHLVDLCA